MYMAISAEQSVRGGQTDDETLMQISRTREQTEMKIQHITPGQRKIFLPVAQ